MPVCFIEAPPPHRGDHVFAVLSDPEQVGGTALGLKVNGILRLHGGKQ
jgi:hypothetical protein